MASNLATPCLSVFISISDSVPSAFSDEAVIHLPGNGLPFHNNLTEICSPDASAYGLLSNNISSRCPVILEYNLSVAVFPQRISDLIQREYFSLTTCFSHPV